MSNIWVGQQLNEVQGWPYQSSLLGLEDSKATPEKLNQQFIDKKQKNYHKYHKKETPQLSYQLM